LRNRPLTLEVGGVSCYTDLIHIRHLMANSFLLFIIFVLLLTNVAKSNVKKEQIKQERNDAIVFCVENPNDCKVEYLKLKK
jgi:hypothetical protein